MNAAHSYDDIICLERHVSAQHPPMTNYDRAAQFSPFAALTGYDAVIRETGRLTEAQGELEEDAKALLDGKLQLLRERLPEHPEARFLVFYPDARKQGGAYEFVTGNVKHIDPVTRCLILCGGEVLPIDRIYGIECDL